MNLNLPNKLTLLRVCMIPVFLCVLLATPFGMSSRLIASVIFILASATDALDGHIARSRNLVTNFGKFMDPLADKLLVAAALISLVELGDLSAVVVIIIISREFIITGFRTIAADANVVIAASKWGKFKTIIQMIMIPVLILNIEFLALIEIILVTLAVVLTIVSMVDYLVKNKNVLKDTEV
ncbi:MAG: CDP-diacylglycerol--glycerol-3-phosphate 3-phosphatidyltransferase [Lachnospirales bacterium]